MSVLSAPLSRLAAVPLPTARDESCLSIATIADQADFTRLRSEWNELLAESPSDSLFLTWEWLHTWWTQLGGTRQLAILTVRRGSQLMAIAPFVSLGTSWLGVKRLEFLGTGQVGSDYLDIIVRRGATPDVLQALANHLIRTGAALDLKQARLTQGAVRELARELRHARYSLRASRTHRCPFIEIGGHSWQSYLGSLGAEQRYSFQRKLRKLETLPGLRFECVASEERRRALLPVLFELHRQRWSERGGGDGLAGPGIPEFHEQLTRLALERGWLRLFVLWIEGVPASALYGFRYGRVFSFYQSGFDPRFQKLSVGVVTLGLAIKSAIEEGASEFDLLHGEEAYKFHWARQARRLGRVLAFPAGPLGSLSWATAVAGDAARGLLRRRASAAQGSSRARRGGRHAAPTR